MLWFFAFVLNFNVAGMTGILLSSPPVDYEVHNSLFLIAHFHGMVLGSFLFGFFAAFTYWWPKATGFVLSERLGTYAFWCWFVGFLLAFMPLYMLGFMGATRRLDHYDPSTGWQPIFLMAAVGVSIIFCGVIFQGLQIFYSITNRKRYADKTGDPWNGRTLEWSVSSPPPVYNFAKIPIVNDRDPFWAIKRGQAPKADEEYEDIYLPRNSGIPIYMGGFALVAGFALTWHIYWMAMIAVIGLVISLIIRLSGENGHDLLTAAEVQKMEEKARISRGEQYA
jgi:cytochrome o ubiquinol oxidase subunit 1